MLEATDSAPDPERLAAMTAYEMAATVEFGLEAKQGLLELRSENARLRLLARLLRAARKRLELDRPRAGARALERQGPLRLSGVSALRAADGASRPCAPRPRARSSADPGAASRRCS